VDKSDDESDASSVSEFSVDGNNQIEENAIFIRSLPATVKFNELFDVFSKVGRIKVCLTFC
jgi:RNA recognition motif-containing protein